ncbi:hypothetical protein [Candidatus Viridilinea mediisalina]|uniref:Uncharacterized protein n=1 Tax=Candidatus Viridilinea mediisalina TaxID=2024553 RepID=A0A2A6RQ74_9CHLR|nr:hypothetical protein [Candidatus Viridilinea mediisalina]PDW05115.1 hypothetical protein CJ255_00550 [Candidatus Viridilinea mediisalina]
MSTMIDLTARLLAYQSGRAIPIRRSSALIADPSPTFAIVPIRMVAEQVVYALAYGDPEGEPEVVLTWNPLDRDASFMEPFAATLDRYLSDCVIAGEMPRIWLAHAAALEVIALLGHRYRTNRSVGPELQRMGAQCRLLAEETTFAGQQIVAIAGSLLASHVATGQSPSEDLHLGALLAWIDPPAGTVVADAAAQAALAPAAAMLDRAADDRVEQLRARVARGRLREPSARVEAEAIIREEALREWALLVRARRAFWGLGLTQGTELTKLTAESFKRVAWQIDRNYGNPARPRSLAQRLDELTYAKELTAYADVADDPINRAAALNAGRVLDAVVFQRDQPRRGFNPCTLTLETRQNALRIRPGTQLQLRGSRVFGRITEVREVNAGQATQLTLVVTNGVRNPQLPTPGQRTEWMEPEPADLRYQKRQVYERMAASADPRVFGDTLPLSRPQPIDDDLATIARRLRR